MNKSLYLIFLLFIVRIHCFAQSSSIDTARTILQEIVLFTNRFPDSKISIAQQVQVINHSTIDKFNAQSTPDLLSHVSNVAVQKSQQGGGSPVLRGFEANRVLLVIDGIRMNNLIYRGGHLQNSVTIDNSMIDRIEILCGPSSTVYGTDALGGVIHFQTLRPQLADEKEISDFSANSFIRYGSVNREKTAHIDFNIANKKMASLTSFTFSDFDDLQMGRRINPALGYAFGLRNQYVVRDANNNGDLLVNNEDIHVQRFSGYKQYDFMQKFLIKPTPGASHLVNLQYSTSSNIPRYDRLTDPDVAGLTNAVWYYGPQKRFLAAYSLTANDIGKLADAFNACVSIQSIEESRHQRKFDGEWLQHRNERVSILGLNLDFEKHFRQNIIRYGIDGQFQGVNSTAYQENIVSGGVSSLDTRYPNGENRMHTLGLYATHILQLGKKLFLNDGFRIGGSWLKSEFVSKDFFFPFDKALQKNITSSGNLALVYSPGSWKLSFMGSTGFRVPNIDDLAKVFESSPGNLIVPNPDLKPERSFTTDVSITKFLGSKIKFENVFFGTRLYDAIVTDDYTFNGQDYVEYNGTYSRVLANQNKERAYIYGYSGNLYAPIHPNVILEASLHYTYGRIKTDTTDVPIDHISPLCGRVSLQFSKSKFSSEIFTVFNGWKKIENYRLNTEDNEAYATPKGMPSWLTINFRFSYKVTEAIRVQLGVDNIMDLQYRTFSSGINAPGRNIFGTLRLNL